MSLDPALLAAMAVVMVLFAAAVAIAVEIGRLSRRRRDRVAFDEAVAQALDLAEMPDDAAGIEAVRRAGREAWHIHHERNGGGS